ncbi:hypothetical protein D5086_000619 [Populus alba]|uniref:Uncharacterized protein n=1 Tax=Populus alba TaxID=43335 RepID=A0ACC4CWV6_POPAL
MDGIKPDSLSVASVLPACARTIAHKNGKAIHGHLLGNGRDLNLIVQKATVDMYAKSELVDCALKVFERMKKRDAISWTLMILIRLFDEARAFIEKHHIEGHAEALRALLDGCWIHHR